MSDKTELYRSDIIKKIDEVFDKLLHHLSLFDQEQVNTIPFEGSWTAGQLARHLVKSNSGFTELIKGEVKETDREPDEFAEPIKESFLDLTEKMTSPDYVVPETWIYKKLELLKELKKIKDDLKTAVLKSDLTKICILFELPVLGYLTGIEAAYFVIYHTQRHIHQLKNIYNKTRIKTIKED